MLIRIPLLIIGAILAAQHLVVLGMIVVLLSVPLPWIAVLIANDGPPVNGEAPARCCPVRSSYDRAIESSHHVIDEDGPESERPPRRLTRRLGGRQRSDRAGTHPSGRCGARRDTGAHAVAGGGRRPASRPTSRR